MQMQTQTVIENRPDNLLIALINDKSSFAHVRTLVGLYSEFLPGLDLTDRQQKGQIYQEFNGQILVFLNNLLKSKADFKKFIDYCLQHKATINFEDIFNDLDYVLNHYTFLDRYNPYRWRYPVKSSIFQDSVMIRHTVREFVRRSDV
ncbi:hypothetical protein J41TS12_36990 [Paenibacillus antibioticophila]|uniref:Uncharacterized protein n=1 Tax=Paenibacillus antibioticophila TaxID=1274374 RepID=A0A919XYG8_9BACL|nr:hypothetical protein [Paenibacillus antibioticophila]GIO38838.1 hypothetical protein J41TS12_36990 [Paenibacillus antibioticophila]